MTAQGSPQQPQSRLPSLPRELRDEIYTYYLQEPGGYVNFPSTNKLRCSNREAIDFGLMRTFKMVASGMLGPSLYSHHICDSLHVLAYVQKGQL